MNRIRDLRTSAGWRQADLAEKLHIKKNTVSRYETESLGLDTATIHALCDLFGCTADYLLGRSQVLQPAITDQQLRLLQAYDAADARDREYIDHLLRLDVPAEEKKAV